LAADFHDDHDKKGSDCEFPITDHALSLLSEKKGQITETIMNKGRPLSFRNNKS
jgi:hypothetical protein